MAETWQRQSPLARRTPLDGAAGFAMTERAFLAKITVRGKVTDDAIRDALGASLPSEPNTASSGEDHTIVWLGPDEWLVVGPPETEGTLSSTLATALPDAAFIDVTEGYATIRLGGPLVGDVLSMGTPLDLTLASSPPVRRPAPCLPAPPSSFTRSAKTPSSTSTSNAARLPISGAGSKPRPAPTSHPLTPEPDHAERNGTEVVDIMSGFGNVAATMQCPATSMWGGPMRLSLATPDRALIAPTATIEVDASPAGT